MLLCPSATSNKMIELPNYSSQLMQQLWALRKEGHFCDCTILVGESPHRAHKLVLAASSMLFRSLLDGSDTISIDTAVVSSQEFGCLLDMVYTGKLPLGKHNVSRIVAAADNLQMFDVAVGFKNVLTSLVNRPPPVQVLSTQTSNLSAINKAQSVNPVSSSPSNKDDSASDKVELRTEPKKEHSQDDADPSSALEKLMSRAKEGQLNERALFKLLRAVQQKASSSFPPSLVSLLEEVEENAHESNSDQTGGEDEHCVESEQQNDSRSEEKQVEEGEGEESNTKEETEEDDKDTNATTDSSSPPPPSSLSPSKPYSCRWCKKCFAYKCRMLAHVKRCSMSQECMLQQCHMPAPSCHIPGMIYHKRTEHFEEKPFVCEECGAKFGANSSLKNHMRLHTGEKPYHCKHCDMNFIPCVSLKPPAPRSSHPSQSIQRWHNCKECGKGFSFACQLEVHMRWHTKEKPYSCAVCRKSFTTVSMLKRHHRIHTGEKPFRCHVCGKCFNQSAHLNTHFRKDKYSPNTE
uniref:Zinc finger and BTB domain containing 40 n=1 Tax=Anabas testudineus TaxID=64144 RepID=A0A3Q1HAD0_ANATE